MCNHLNLKILIHIFANIYLIMIIIIMRGENFVAHLDGLSSTPVCPGTPVAHRWYGETLIIRSRTLPSVFPHRLIWLHMREDTPWVVLPLTLDALQVQGRKSVRACRGRN
jgi:hypothetical protein